MRILQVNKFFYPRGGSEGYFFNIAESLQHLGHQVSFFSMQHPNNRESTWSLYFVRNREFREKISLFKAIPEAFKSVYSLEAKKKITLLIKEEKPDVAHLHNWYYHLTPSIVYALKRRNIPVVITLHDYHVSCPSNSHYDFLKDEICEDCRGRRFYSTLRRRCIHGSLAQCAIGSLEAYLYWYSRFYETKVDMYLSPSRFLMSKVVEEGLPQDRIRHLPLFVDLERFHPAKEKQEYFLYCGRLEKMKGLHILIQAMAQLRKGRLLILGEGPLRPKLERQVREEKLERHVNFLGYQSGESLLKLIREARFLVIPSQWFENQPLTILEAHASGTAVVGSNLGGIAEMVEAGEDGLLFDYTSPADLAEKIDFMIKDPASAQQMGLRGRERVSQKHCKELHIQKLIELYQQLITSSNSS